MANDAVAIRPPNSSAIAGPGPNGLGAISSEDVAQKAVYEQAYALLKARKIDEAMIALIKYNETYPNGIYAANAQYWLGEVYLLKNDLPEATAAFRSVIAQHSDHRKVDDAKYKLGKIYHLQNQPEQAKELLLSVSKGSGSAAKLAQDYLSLHF
jgi:tol-pal system protein YbgF